MYEFYITYKDTHPLKINVKESEGNAFMEALSDRKVFWSDEVPKGFWTNIDDIRFIQIKKIDESTGEVVSVVELEDLKEE